MGAGAAAFLERRFVVAVAGTNFTVQDSGTGQTTTTALAAAATQTLLLFNMAAGGVVLAAKCKPTVAFTGGALTAVTVEVGIANFTDSMLRRFNVFIAIADTALRRCVQVGPSLKFIQSALPDTTGATPAAPVAMTVTGAVAGDQVLGAGALYGPAAGFTEAGSTGGNVARLDHNDLEANVTVADQVQAVDPGAPADLTPYTGSFLLGGVHHAADTATTAVNALFRGTAGNVNLLTAGSLEIALLIWDAPIIAQGNG